jgi:hypothetical protein
MKRSKFIVTFLTVLVCFAIGFGIGAFPDRWQKLQGRPAGHLILLTSGSKILPAEFLYDFEKATGIPVEVKSIESYHLFRTEAQDADLLFAPLAWLGSFPETLKELPSQEDYRHLLSTDFQTLKLDLPYFLPVLWKTEQRENRTHLVIWGFATPKPQSTGLTELLNFLLTSNRRLRDWATVTGLNFTLEKTDEIKDFPEAQRAQKIRDVSLPNLVIDQKL